MSDKPTASFAIHVDGLSKKYRNIDAISDIDLDVPVGSVVGLIGPNGAGKTTFIKMLLGLVSPSQGNVCTLGLDPFTEPLAVRQRVGYVPELHHIYRWMSVEQVIGFCHACYERWNHERCSQMLQLFDLCPDQKVRNMSKGSLGKLALLLAVSHDPELLVLDEPMAGLDPLAREEVLDGVLRALVDQQTTVIFSSHSMADVQRLADSIAILYEGRLAVYRQLDDLLSNAKRIRATLVNGQPPDHVPEGLICQRVNGRDWELTVDHISAAKIEQLRRHDAVEHVEVTALGLEDLFKDIVRGQRGVS